MFLPSDSHTDQLHFVDGVDFSTASANVPEGSVSNASEKVYVNAAMIGETCVAPAVSDAVTVGTVSSRVIVKVIEPKEPIRLAEQMRIVFAPTASCEAGMTLVMFPGILVPDPLLPLEIVPLLQLVPPILTENAVPVRSVFQTRLEVLYAPAFTLT